MPRPKTYQEILILYPRRICAWETDPGTGTVMLYRPKFTSDLGLIFSRWFLKNRLLSLKLDQIGSVCWQLCNGQNDVAQVVNQMQTIMGEAIEPALERVVKFLIHLEKNDFLTFRNSTVSPDQDQSTL